ncbi:UbiD family decarboxylase [Ottowia sp.]|uniref:UbiD family decarboxylase n=1 Tax=Ottowia sp. TaxID=1898956 RepID=UPI002CF75B39|nr:UbiD family decarboxylase [Ottowia sp.]HRN75029.1 UbiD family decarboxylase [Ottowia sp.]HRQ02133.1 UbiD family decarboxylase [Ottowia sp.]
MAWRDLRELLDGMAPGDLRRVAEPFAPRHEIAAALRQAPADAPALLFENVVGHPGWRVAGNLIATRRRLALALGAPVDELADFCARRRGQAVEPVLTGDVPVQQVVHQAGDDLLGRLPILTHHAGDGGPYITIGVVMCRDPETGERGMGVHRMMVKGGRRLTVMFSNPPMSRLHAAAEARGEPLPVVIALGLDPATLIGAVVRSGGGQGADKLGFSGALRGRAVELAPARTVALEVPARAEAIIEGHVLCGVREHEGPFGENTGTYFSDDSPVIEVSAVTHREQPVYPGLSPAGADVDMLLWLAAGADLLAQLRAQVAGVVDLEIARGTAAFSMVVAVHCCSRSEARRLAHLALALDRRLKTITVVDDDIDIRDPEDVAWALATRWQPARDTVVIEGTDAYVIDPSASGAGQGSKAAFIALHAAGGGDERMRLDAAALAKAQALFRQPVL